jgi:indole-3-glycerol phosphate synthase
MVAAGRDRVREAKARVGEAALARLAGSHPKAKSLGIHVSGFDVIAEIKRRSPSRGVFDRGPSGGSADRGAVYARAGALGVSVVTEPTAFEGSLELLAATSALCGVPTMRKDFLVDPYQLLEARVHGAAGVLLIVRALPGGLLREMIAAAGALGLFVLIEAFDAADLDRGVEALDAADGVALLGVNARDLVTLALDPMRHAALARRVPPEIPLVAESGIGSADDAAHVARLGYRAALVGEALMRLDDPAPLLAGLLAAGREAAAAREVTR